jgi:hypothetical protein
VSQEILNDSVARAEAARNRAIDFESPAYFPSEWDAIEAQYTAARDMPKSTQSDIQQAASLYNTAANAYDDIFRKTIPLYAQAREDEIISAREELINTGLTRTFPEYLRNADEMALAALSQFEAGDYYKARDTAADTLSEYETLLVGARIMLARNEIVDRGFIVHDSENFYIADEIACEAIEEFEAGNRKEAMTTAEEALLLYNVVLTNGWTIYATDRRAYAVLERELAITERANIASRSLFNEADAIFAQAERNFVSENFRSAANFYVDSEARFAISRYDTEERRQRALDTIRIAEEKIEESSETAIEAGRIIEGGSR